MLNIEINELLQVLNKVRLEDSEKEVILKENESFREKGIDSLTLASFYFAVEEKYKVSIPDNKLSRINSLQDLKKFLEGHIN